MVTKLLEVLGLSTILSFMLNPVMELMGLPGSLGIVWATALISSPYGALAVFASLAPGMDLSVEQITVLCSVILIAHSLPVESSISKRAGGPVMPLALLRLGGALVYGILLHKFCLAIGAWQDPVSMMFSGGMASATLWQWIWSQIINLALIFFVIFCILTAMRLLRMVGFLRLVEVVLTPILPFFGLTPHAAPVTVVGMIMGLGFGGALIIRETTGGKMTKREVFNSLALMGLCHGLVEDTLLMMAIGGKLAGILFGRLLFSLFVLYTLNKMLMLVERLKLVRS